MNTATITLVIAVVGAVTGVLGLVFNFLTTWRSFDRDRVKLKVSPRIAILSHPVTGTRHLLCVEVTNLSYLPVTVSQVAFTVTEPKDHFFAFMPVQELGQWPPTRLEPRTSMTVYVPEHISSGEGFLQVKKAFAQTECGHSFYGTSPALDGHVEQLRNQFRLGKATS
jgi:hypothetical protein